MRDESGADGDEHAQRSDPAHGQGQRLHEYKGHTEKIVASEIVVITGPTDHNGERDRREDQREYYVNHMRVDLADHSRESDTTVLASHVA